MAVAPTRTDCLSTHGFARIVEPALRPACRINNLDIFLDKDDADVLQLPIKDLSEIGRGSWIVVALEVEESATGETFTVFTHGFVTDQGNLVSIVHIGAFASVGGGNPEELGDDVADAIADSLSVAIQLCL